MAWEQHTEIPLLLREGHYLYFVGGWPAPSMKEGKWFRVDRAQQIKYDVNRIVAATSSIDLDFAVPAGGGLGDKNLSLIPQNTDTLYELLLGIKGNVLVYPIYNNSYYLRLEATNVLPDTSNARLRYIGFWDESDSAFDAPKLREYVIKDQQAPVLRLYNDMFLDEPAELRFIVNRTKLIEAPPPSEEVRRVARVVKYHTYFVY